MFLSHMKLSDEQIAKLPPRLQAAYKKPQQSVVAAPKPMTNNVEVEQPSVPVIKSASSQFSNNDLSDQLPPHLQPLYKHRLELLRGIDWTRYNRELTVGEPVQNQKQAAVVVQKSNGPTLTNKPTRREMLKAAQEKK